MAKYLGMFGYGTHSYVARFGNEAVRIDAENFLIARREAARYLLRDEPIGKRKPERVVIIDCEVAGWDRNRV